MRSSSLVFLESLLERRDSEGRFVRANKFPVGQQFFVVKIDPDLHHPKLARWQRASQNNPVWDGDCGLVLLIASMKMGSVVLTIIAIKKRNNDSIKHRDRWHVVRPMFMLSVIRGALLSEMSLA